MSADAEAPFCAAELASVLTDVEATEREWSRQRLRRVAGIAGGQGRPEADRQSRAPQHLVQSVLVSLISANQ
jgi:hypothetical protein